MSAANLKCRWRYRSRGAQATGRVRIAQPSGWVGVCVRGRDWQGRDRTAEVPRRHGI